MKLCIYVFVKEFMKNLNSALRICGVRTYICWIPKENATRNLKSLVQNRKGSSLARP